jgi:hypothetical protein
MYWQRMTSGAGRVVVDKGNPQQIEQATTITEQRATLRQTLF